LLSRLLELFRRSPRRRSLCCRLFESPLRPSPAALFLATFFCFFFSTPFALAVTPEESVTGITSDGANPKKDALWD